MNTAVGIFNSQADALTAYRQLRANGYSDRDLIVLTPRTTDDKLQQVPTEEGEQPGMGKAIGGVVGGAIGLAAGAAVATLLLPGVGTVLALGLAAAPLGIGGAVAGAAAGDALENLLTRGIPKDEIFFYEDALRKGRTVLIALSDDEEMLARAREIMSANGAESQDAAREQWWIGLRDAEDVHYQGARNTDEEQIYRRGFEAALEPDFRGRSFEEARAMLQRRFPETCSNEWFERGYVKAQLYYVSLIQSSGSEEQPEKKSKSASERAERGGHPSQRS